MSDSTRQALDIATHDLRACYYPEGIVAGNHHFTDYWARDGFFAAFGSLTLGDTEIVGKMVDLFFSHQRPDGLIPYRVMRGPISLGKYFGHPKLYPSPHPTYRLRSVGQAVFDGTTLTLLFAALLGKKSYLNQIKLALTYLESKEKHGLLWDGPMGEWNDVVWKWGNLLYSNIIYWYMYDRLANWADSFDSEWSKSLKLKQTAIGSSLRRRLWNGKYFADWHDFRRQDFLYPFGNCLAVIWGFTTPAETESILKAIKKTAINFSYENNSPKYPWWRVDLLNRLAGMGDYQNQAVLWWQPVTSYLAALITANHKQEAELLRDQIATKILTDGSVYECYERSGKPVKRRLYSSEHPFAWASGMILWANSFKPAT